MKACVRAERRGGPAARSGQDKDKVCARGGTGANERSPWRLTTSRGGGREGDVSVCGPHFRFLFVVGSASQFSGPRTKPECFPVKCILAACVCGVGVICVHMSLPVCVCLCARVCERVYSGSPRQLNVQVNADFGRTQSSEHSTGVTINLCRMSAGQCETVAPSLSATQTRLKPTSTFTGYES